MIRPMIRPLSRAMAPPPPLPLDVRLMNRLAALLALLFVAMSLVLLGQWLVRQPVFSLQAIRIENELQRNNAVTLRANVAPKLAGNFFTLDLLQAKTAFEAVPWVRQAVVRREFPDRLRVRLVEHEAVAFWGMDDDARLINSHGEVFEVNQGDMEAEELPRLIGPRSQAPEVLRAFRVLAPMFETLDNSDRAGTHRPRQLARPPRDRRPTGAGRGLGGGDRAAHAALPVHPDPDLFQVRPQHRVGRSALSQWLCTASAGSLNPGTGQDKQINKVNLWPRNTKI